MTSRRVRTCDLSLPRRVHLAASLCALSAATYIVAPPVVEAAEGGQIKLFFTAGDAEHGRELWRTDGTRAGTRMVRDIRPGERSSHPENFRQLGKWLLFSADDGRNGRELWRTDGTAAGTRMVINMRGDEGYDEIYVGPRVGRYVYLRAWNRYGPELWRTDGTKRGTRMVRDIFPGADGALANSTGMEAMNGIVYFGARSPGHGRELWRSNGTRAGTYMVKDINLDGNGWGSTSAHHTVPKVFGDSVYFKGADGEHGRELWRTDGTARGTRRITDFASDGSDSSDPYALTPAGDRLYFMANSLHGGGENSFYPDLWRTDGTRSGTVLVKGDTYTRPVHMASAVFYGSGKGLHRTSINPRSRVLIDEFFEQPVELANVDRTLYFSAPRGQGYELWRSDGTQNGATLVEDINPRPFINNSIGSSYPREITDAAGTPFYFTADDGVHGRELWRSDGTAEGTYLVRDILSSRGSKPSELTRFDRP